MGTLKISNATYGRDTAGKKKLVADLLDDIKKVRSELTGKELTELNDTIGKYWVGKDAETFKSKIKSTVNNIDAEVKKISKTLEQEFDDDAKGFAKLQSTNASTISGLK